MSVPLAGILVAVGAVLGAAAVVAALLWQGDAHARIARANQRRLEMEITRERRSHG